MHGMIAPRPRRRQLVAAVIAGLLVIAGTLALWASYGTAVFFETLRAGFVGCFG